MRKVALFLLLNAFLLSVKAQDSTDRCGVPDMDTTEFTQLPWFDNNQMLEDFLDSIGYPSPNARIMDGETKYRIPVKFWIYRADNGTGGPTELQIQRMMDNLNRLYNGVNDTKIGFYMKCSPTYINNSADLHTSIPFGANWLFSAHHEDGCVNVHVVDDLTGTIVGYSSLFTNSVIVDNSSYTRSLATPTLAHEIGHVFGLVHTHLYSWTPGKCYKECVSRTRSWPLFNFCLANRFKKVCESTGDALKDTPADPNLSSNNDCNYTLGGSDPWGDPYPSTGSEAPETSNIMSYNGDENCVGHFSRLQIAVMLRTIIWHKIHHGYWDNNSYIYDSYEPDNSSELARSINIGETQEHNFHRQYNGLFNSISDCDVDWVRFTPTVSASVSFITSAIASRTNADTRLTVFNNSLTQLAQNDNISGTNLYSSVSLNVTAGQTYFIRIENMAPGTTTYYQLSANCSSLINTNFQILGNTTICSSSGGFSIQDFPPGTAVQWTVSPAGIAGINCSTCPQINLSKIVDGVVTLTASFTVCSQNFTINKQVIFGPPTTTCSVVSGGSCLTQVYLCPSQLNNWQYVYIPGNWGPAGTGFHIEAQGGAYFNGGATSMNITTNSFSVWAPSLGAYNSSSITVSAMNGCGVSPYQPYVIAFIEKDSYQCGYYYYSIAPNPVNSTMSVTISKGVTDAAHTSFDQISIYDQQGNLKLTRKLGKVKTSSINVSNLATGMYIVEISDGTYKERQQLIVQK